MWRPRATLKGLTKKAHYVQALLDSGWVQGMDDDDDDVLPDDGRDLVEPADSPTSAEQQQQEEDARLAQVCDLHHDLLYYE